MAILAAYDIFILKSLSKYLQKERKPEIIAAERGSHQFVAQLSCMTRRKVVP
jgi:hypothetical protein